MRGIATLGGILALLLLTSLSAMGEDSEIAVDSEDPWDAIDVNLIASKVEVKDISGKYADVTQGVYAEIDGNDTTPYPYQEDGLYIWTIEQHGSALLGTIESSEGDTYQLIGATSMDEVMLVYFGPEMDYEANVTVEVEGILDGEILESGEIVFNGIGYEYTIDPENADNYTFNDYYAETTVLMPIEE